MVKETIQLFPTLTNNARDDYDTCKKQHDKVIDAIIIAQDELYASAPFITEDIYNNFCEVENLCKQQLMALQDFRLRPDADDYRVECKEAYDNAYKRTHEIHEKFKLLLATIRTYITSIDVIE